MQNLGRGCLFGDTGEPWKVFNRGEAESGFGLQKSHDVFCFQCLGTQGWGLANVYKCH